MRTWTDEHLRAAVASSTSWKGVATALGLAQSSTPRLKRHARRLGLNTSHFKGRRRWSDADLRTALAMSSTWPEVLEALDVSDDSNTRQYVRGHATRLGIDISRLTNESVPVEVCDVLTQTPDLRRRLRVAAESIASAWFALRGIPVAVPSMPCQYDLLVTLASGVKRVQVKSGCVRQHGSWLIRIGRRPYIVDKSAGRVPYDPDDIDYFLLMDGDGFIYFIPSSVVAGRTSVNVGAYRAFRVGDASSLFEVTA